MREIYIRNLSKNSDRRSITSAVCSFESEVTAVVNGQKYNAKSIMNTPVIDNAENIDFSIIGADEENVETAIKKLYNLNEGR